MVADAKPKRRAETNGLVADDQPATKRQVDYNFEESMPSSDDLAHNNHLADLVVPVIPGGDGCSSGFNSNSTSGTDWQQWQAELGRAVSPMDISSSQQDSSAVVAVAAAATPPTPA
jgi:hypothetical protein